jgi:hypothetical protein
VLLDIVSAVVPTMAALQGRVTLYTTLAGGRAACTGMQQSRELKAYAVQSLHARIMATVH